MDKGYIQTSYSACMILKNTLDFPEERLTLITKSYIEILRHFGFFKLATLAINNSSSDIIKRINKSETTIHTRCGTCKKVVERSMKTICEKCNKYMICAYCRLPLKGLLLWCQVCCHAGHLKCMMKWFEQKSVCPGACECKCYKYQPS